MGSKWNGIMSLEHKSWRKFLMILMNYHKKKLNFPSFLANFQDGKKLNKAQKIFHSFPNPDAKIKFA